MLVFILDHYLLYGRCELLLWGLFDYLLLLLLLLYVMMWIVIDWRLLLLLL
jgi:hypothetical protein